MDQDAIVGQLVNRCKSAIEAILQPGAHGDVASASLAILAKFRDVGRAVLQAKVDLEASRLPDSPGAHCQGAAIRRVHTRKVRPQTLLGEIAVPVRTFRCDACDGHVRPDDVVLGVPARGEYTDDVRSVFAPLDAELPHRVACDVLERATGVRLSPHGAQSMAATIAADLRAEKPERERLEDVAVARALAGPERQLLGVEVSFDGVMAHVDGDWHEAKVGSVIVRQVNPEAAADQRRGAVLARRVTCVRGAPEDLGRVVVALIAKSGWSGIPVVEVLGDGAPWIWNLASAVFPNARQTLDWWHLRQHFFAYASVQWSDAKKAEAWVDAKMDALMQDRVGAVLSGLKRTRARGAEAREELAGLVRYVETNQTRISYGLPGSTGFAIGSGSVEGACKHLVQTRFKRAGMRWKGRGFDEVLELRIGRLNGTLDDFWQRARARSLAA